MGKKVQNSLHFLSKIVGKGINKACISLTCHEKCVMCITGWVLLWLEQRIKIPKWTFHKVVCRHLSKPENKIIIIINSYSFNQWIIFLLLNTLWCYELNPLPMAMHPLDSLRVFCILVLYLKIQFDLAVDRNRGNSDLETKTRRFTLV